MVDELDQPLQIAFPSAVPSHISFPQEKHIGPVGDIHIDDYYRDPDILNDEAAVPKRTLSLESDYPNYNYYYELSLQGTAHSRVYMVAIPITKVERISLAQKNLGTFFGNWRPGEFKHSFSDLKLATHDFESLELEDIEKILDIEAARGEEVVEVLGFKIPLEQMTLWGTVIVLGVQIYFLLFLKQLESRLTPEDAGWDVPWIGIDQTKLGQYILFLTMVVLPCAALAVLGGHAILSVTADYRDAAGHFWHWPPSILGKIAVILVALGAATVLAAFSWKYRPQIAPEPELPEYPDGLSRKWMRSR